MTLRNAVVLAVVLMLSFAFVGCDLSGDDNNGGGGSPVAPTPTPPSTPPTPPSTPTPPSSPDGGTQFHGTVPRASGMDHLQIYGRGSLGTSNDVDVCVWDYSLIDGDLLNIWVAGYSLVVDDNATIELFADPWCWSFTMRTGYYYPIRILALNEGSVSPNTGAVSVELYRPGHNQSDTQSDTQQWSVPLNTNASASIVIHVP